MSQSGQQDPRETLAAVGRAWEWVLAFGALTALAGILVVAWPEQTVRLRSVRSAFARPNGEPEPATRKAT